MNSSNSVLVGTEVSGRGRRESSESQSKPKQERQQQSRTCYKILKYAGTIKHIGNFEEGSSGRSNNLIDVVVSEKRNSFYSTLHFLEISVL